MLPFPKKAPIPENLNEDAAEGEIMDALGGAFD